MRNRAKEGGNQMERTEEIREEGEEESIHANVEALHVSS